MDIADLNRILDAELESDSYERMVNAFGRHCQPPLAIAIRHITAIDHSLSQAGTNHRVENAQRVVEVLLECGASVAFLDAYEIMSSESYLMSLPAFSYKQLGDS
jgi:hypothetical protein